MKINQVHIEKLLSFLHDNKDSYFVIGGHAAAVHFENAGLEFRTTKDFDIVLVTKLDDSDFSKQVASFLIEGGYENRYRNERKTAYRFENPKFADFPMIIEFFVEEGKFPESLDKKLAKLDIKVNEEKISAIVLENDIYEFAKKHVVTQYDLPIVDVKGLIALKTYAYFRNLELYELKLVKSDDYLKHKKDVFRLLTILDDTNPIENIPGVLKTAMSNFLPILENADDLSRNYKIPLKTVVDAYKKIAGL